MTKATRALGCARWSEMGLFLLLTFGSTWLSAWLLHALSDTHARQALVTRLFAASWMYALTMGIQPLLALWVVHLVFPRRARLDQALRPARPGFIGLAVVLAVSLCGAAALLALLLHRGGSARAELPAGALEPYVMAMPPSWQLAVTLVLLLIATLVCVWFQALTEEVAWRGYFLAHWMDLLGPWQGLWLHGVIWGAWYAPVLMFAAGQGELDVRTALAFVVSCMLLGVLLAWLRLASRSIVPVVVANVTVTLGAGLPYAIHGIDPGARGALFGPIGWVLMAAAVVCVASTRLRDVIKVPRLVLR